MEQNRAGLKKVFDKETQRQMIENTSIIRKKGVLRAGGENCTRDHAGLTEILGIMRARLAKELLE